MSEKLGKYRIICDMCKTDRHVNEYSDNPILIDGYRWICNECEFKITTELKTINRADNLESLMFARAKTQSKKRGIPFGITIKDVVIPTHCPYLGSELIREAKRTTHNSRNVASLDRINNSLGYIPFNIEVISLKANTMKNNASSDELIMFARAVLSRDWKD